MSKHLLVAPILAPRPGLSPRSLLRTLYQGVRMSWSISVQLSSWKGPNFFEG